MATKVFEEKEIELQDGTEVTLRPLPIKQLRKFMAVIESIEEDGSETDNIEKFYEASVIALSKFLPDKDEAYFEEVLDLPTMMEILQAAGGVSFESNPLLAAAAAAQQEAAGKN